MKSKVLTTTIEVYERPDLLHQPDQQLLAQAVQALEASYSPYSQFQVGAALLLKEGQIVAGSNQENASYPLCLCAERVALAAAAAQHPGQPIVAMAITAHNPKHSIERPVAPCGACRQVLLETEQRHRHPIRLILRGDSGSIYVVESAKALLPLSFDASFL